MPIAEDFARECDYVAKAIRRTPKEVRKELNHRVKDEVARPLAHDIGAAARGPYAHVLRAGAKARAGADPKVIVGGKRPRVSGGAGPRQLVYGTEFGAKGQRRVRIPRTPKHKGYTRYATRQFLGKKHPFIFPTIERQLPRIFDTFADIVIDVLDREVK